MKRMPGFTLVELVVVLVVAMVLVSILYPVFAPRHREVNRQTPCLSNVRQMCTAVAMYMQDHKGYLPSANWTADIAEGGVNAKMLTCPSSTADVAKGEISYGYNSLLIKPNGKGISEQQMRNPSEVGVICDADPVGTVGGLIGGGYACDVQNTPVVTPSNRHAGVIAGFADGHAKYLPGNFKINGGDYTDPVFRAFYMVVNIGLVDPVGGAIDPLPAGKAATVAIGGDGCTEPLIAAAARAWNAATPGSKIMTRGFNGVANTLGQRTKGFTSWAWGSGDGQPGSNLVIGHDVLLMIVNQNCKIGTLIDRNDKQPTAHGIAAADQVYCATPGDIARLFAAGYAESSVQAYTFDAKSGSRAFFQRAFGVKTIGKQAITVADDREMQDKVAADPYGIGYMSNALVDLSRVQVLGIRKADGTYQIYPQADAKHRWEKPVSYKGYLGYRDLYITAHGNTADIAAVLQSPGFLANPLYTLGFERP
jgi:type II secretory pathway pseudopilin PulG/inorganic pyrophosphatase